MNDELENNSDTTRRGGQRFRRWFIAAAVVGCVIALFYAEEDWRGRRTWEQFKGVWEAKGDHFDLAGVVPPPVPSDQNFALTDIAFSSYGFVLTRDGKLIPPEQRPTNFVTRMLVSLTPDYPGPTNCAGNWTRATFTRLDCWQVYYRQLAARTNGFPVPAQAGSPAADVLVALGKHDAVIEEVRVASKLPCSRFPLNYDSEAPFDIHLPHLAALKSCANVLQLRGVAELQNGQADKAFEDARLGLRLTDTVRTEPFLISHVVRMAMVELLLQPVWEGLADHAWPDAHLAALEQELSRLDFVAAYRQGVRSELGAQSSEMDRLRLHPEKLRELDGMRDLDGNLIPVKLPGNAVVRLIPSGWFYQNQYRCARLLEEYYLPAADEGRGTFAPETIRRGDAALAAEAAGAFNLGARFMLPFMRSSARKLAHGQAAVNLARTAIALERYRLARGELPGSLEVLAPQFIAKVPADVIGDRPLRYRREPGGKFVLYSVGWNEKDDGGVPGLKPDRSLDLESGDWVWRNCSRTD